MSENEKDLDSQAPQPSVGNEQSTETGESAPAAPEKNKVRKKKGASPTPDVKRLDSIFDLALENLPLIERDKEFRLDELDLHEIRERNMKTINDYVVRRKTSMPPSLTALDVGSGKPVVVDGVTRYIAAGLDGAETITVNVYKGTREQLKLLAPKLNQHGVNLSKLDIKRQIDQFDEEYKDNPLSTREMAKLVGISHTAVAGYRATRGQSTLEGIKSMRRGKTPDEKRAAMVKAVLRVVEEQGDEILRDIVMALPASLRKGFLDSFFADA